VALPAVLSITMAVGAEQLAKKKAIVSRLVAIEEMAGMDILFADKTGTLTQNKLTIGKPTLIAAKNPEEILQAAALASRRDSEDTIDKAIFAALPDGKALEGCQVTHFDDFDAVRKYADAEVNGKNGSFSVAKGAAQAILKLANADDKLSDKVNRIVDDMGANGYRALAIARKDGDAWHVLGILPMSDPPRQDSRDTIAEARQLGLDIRMVTGDHLAIAKQIASQVGLGQNIAVASDLFDDKGNVRDDKRLMEAEGYAEVFPEHKFNIVTAFQKAGHIAGMTGDGVNDAPALRRADVGIAVSGATDAARAAAALVLTDAGISVIVGAMHQARLIFGRMQSYAIFRIAETIRVLLFMTFSILLFNFYPVTAVMIVLLALFNDFPIMMIAYDNTEESRKPVRWDMRHVLTISSLLGTLGVIASFLLFWYAQQMMHMTKESLQTLIFLKLLVGGHLTIYITRRHGWFWSRPFPSWKLIVATEATQLAGTLAAVYGWLIPPIGWGYALAVWGYALVWFLVNDAIKIGVNRRILHRSAKVTSPPS
jgi:H+-transporting ATPase